MVKVKKLENQYGTMELSKFMKKYYGISHRDIRTMTHDIASKFFQGLERTSFTYVQKNPELLGQGKVILVKDANNNIAPYIVPEMIIDAEEQYDIASLIDDIIISLKVSSNMSERAIIIIEGHDSLANLINQENLSQKSDTLPELLIEINDCEDVDGVSVTTDGNVSKIKLLNYTLEEVSARTDSIAIILTEDKSIDFITDGVKQEDFDLIMLKTNLHTYLEYGTLDVHDEEKILLDPNSYNFKQMSNYQLSILMHNYKIHNNLEYYHVVRRELVGRTKGKKNNKKREKRNKTKLLERIYREEE